MKKFLVVLLSMMLVLGIAAVSFAGHYASVLDTETKETVDVPLVTATKGAGIDMYGLMFVRGVSKSNYDLNAADTDDARNLQQRYKLWIKGFAAGGASVTMKFDTGALVIDGAGNIDGVDLDMDAMYMTVPLGKNTLVAGVQPASFGYGYDTKGAKVGRVKLGIPVGKSDLWLAYTNEDNVDDVGVSTNLEDTYNVAAILDSSIGAYNLDLAVTHSENGTADTTGNRIQVAFGGKIAGFDFISELSLFQGDKYETTSAIDSTQNDKYGAFAAFSRPLTSRLGASVAGAAARNGFTADDDFHPSVLFGTGNGIGIVNFGQCWNGDDADGNSATVTATTCDVSAVALTLKHKTTAAMSTYLTAAYADFEAYETNTTGGALTAIDAGLSYAIAKGVKYSVDAGIAFPSMDISTTDDSPVGVKHTLQVNF